MKKVALALLVFVSLNADLLELVHKGKFFKCDSAISQEFDSYMNSSDGRVSTDYFSLGGKTFSIMATYGTQGDGVWQHTVFEKDGSICYAYSTTDIVTNKSCIAYKEENPVWKYISSQGDFTWTKNKGNVDALLKNLPNGGCSIKFMLSKKYPADK